MLSEAALHRLLAWNSPAYPVGAFTYSHGLETAVTDRRVETAAQLADYVAAVLERGGAWVDAVLFCHAWRAANDIEALDEICDLAAAFRASSETALESRQQGRAFLDVTRRAWPHETLDRLAERRLGLPVAHAAVVGVAAACQAIPLAPALTAYLHGTASNLVSAGVRLVPLGQTDGQIATAALAAVIDRVASNAATTALDDLGTAAPLLDMASLHHETLYTRLFRS